MTVTAEPPATQADRQAELRCEHCQAPVAQDQEWCLECGAARTLIHAPPSWRIGAAIVAGVVAVALAVFAIALIDLSNQADRSARTAVQTTSAARSAAAAFPGWSASRHGYTVILGSLPTQAAAVAGAQALSSAGIKAGIIYSSYHPALPKGRWMVFTGYYSTLAAARREAAVLRARDYPALARLVQH